MNEAEKKLDELSNCQAHRDALNLQKQELIDQILTPEIKAQIQDVEAEFVERYATVDQLITTLEGEIKAMVIPLGETVKGTHLMAVWNKPRVSWDTGKLDGLALAFPPLNEARKVGDPSVTIRRR